MKRFSLPLVLAALALVSPAPAAQFELGPHHFTVPEGFTVEIAAPASLASRPIEADFDEQGRLYVTDSAGSNEKIDKQLADKPHRILRLEDTNGDGIFDTSIVFADRMMFPEGCMWKDGSLYVSAPPSIWKLTDTNNDGVADIRVEWFKGQTLTGCANDLHGPYLGPDGWIYWCKGAFARQTNILGNGKTFVSRASHIFRARADGTGLEPIMTGGMDNPVGLAWTAEGELVLSGTFFQHPGGGRRDGLIHVLYGGVYGKENDALDGHPRTGELLPIMTHLGPAAPCGLARYEADAFGADYQNNLFACQFNLHKVSRHVLKESGSTFSTVDSDFLVSDNADFHPTDVMEDADGSLLVIDTGGWYKLCCPTSQLPKPDVFGAIYRIRRNAAPKVDDPRGLKLDWEGMKPDALARLLDDKRPVVSRRAIEALVRNGTNSLPALAKLVPNSNEPDPALRRPPPERLRHLVSTLIRIPGNQSVMLWERAIAVSSQGRERDEDRYADSWSARMAVYNSAEFHDLRGGSRPTVSGRLLTMRGNLRRAAMMAYSRLGDTLSPDMALPDDDRSLRHVLIDALIRQGDLRLLHEALDGSNADARHVALVALDQMPVANLKPEQVIPFLTSTNHSLKASANWIIGHHPEWAGALAGHLRDRIATANLSSSERLELQQQLAQFAREPSIQTLVATTVRDPAALPALRLMALHAMSASHLKSAPADWVVALASLLKAGDSNVLSDVIATIRVLPVNRRDGSEISAALLRIAEDPKNPVELRLNSAGALPASIEDPSANLLELVLTNLAADRPVVVRRLAADSLARIRFTDGQLLGLAETARTTGPLELPRLLAAFEKSTNEAVGLKLIAALQESKSKSSVHPDSMASRFTNFPTSVRVKAGEWLATLQTDVAKQKARLDEIAVKLSLNVDKPDIRRGQAIFNGQKAACSTCHAIGYLGGNLGPDLTRIGQVRTERDLLESIVFPSASFVRSFEPLIVVTKSGDEHSGILRRDAPDEIVLATGPNAEVRLSRDEIVEMRPGALSVMPQGLDEQLTRVELADLLAFLKATKW
ncbi:MAG: hypothetical protein QOF48_2993 [Verrucomicrobiota bacterium]